jgi:hypothetical protein
MSRRHPVVAITGSSGAGTTTVTRTFEHIFRREGINAAVVGLLLAALYDPVWTSAIFTFADFAIALAAFIALIVRTPPILVVLATAGLAELLA